MRALLALLLLTECAAECRQAHAPLPHPAATRSPTHQSNLSKPNVVLFLVDDFRPFINASYGAPNASTPFMDSIVQSPRSVVFSRAFTNWPMCAPSRSSLLLGQTPMRVGILNNNNQRGLQTNLTSLFQAFRASGYRAYGGGKVFHPGLSDADSFDVVYAPNVPEVNDSCLLDRRATSMPPLAQFVACSSAIAANKLPDFVVATNAVEQLYKHVAQWPRTPFFLAAGFVKPHVPYHVRETYVRLFFTPKGHARSPRDLGSPVIVPKNQNALYWDAFPDLLVPTSRFGLAPWSPTSHLFRVAARSLFIFTPAHSHTAPRAHRQLTIGAQKPRTGPCTWLPWPRRMHALASCFKPSPSST